MSEMQTDTGVVYRRLLGYAKPYWPLYSAAIAAMVVYAATDTGFAALMRPLLDGSFIEKDPDTIRIIPVLMVALFLARGLAGFVANYCLNYVGRHVIKKLRGEVFEKFLLLPTAVHDQSSTGVLLSKLTYNIEQVAESTTNTITVIIRDTLTIIGLVIWMFYLNVQLALFIFLVGPMIGWLMRIVSARFRRYSLRIQDSMGDVTRVAEEVLSSHRVVKVFNGQEYERRQFERVNEKNRRLFMRMVAVRAISIPVIQLIAAFGMAGIVFLATRPEMLEQLTVGTFISFFTAMLMLMGPLKRLTNVNANLQRGIAAGKSIFEILDTSSEPAGGERRLDRARGDMAFEGVQFSYDAAKGDVLSGIDLAVAAGQTVAFVGRSGSGKSTLINLLPRFYDVTGGRILIDGHDIREYRLADLRRQIALVSQDVTLFNETIARNIAYGTMERADEAAIAAAAKAAHVTEFTDTLPDGLDTLVGDRGVLLSGGQRQRVAIARALLKDAPVLILDEATSALDSESERHIRQALDALMQHRTTLVIAHRLSTVENADLIVVLDSGRIVETGTHASLIERGGHYASLYRMQFDEEPIE
ncbi:MAG: lipid A export permease/ATP-binding protein MsbA [Gammaproteobacteria bacterium]|nr:lipid A export permease/ATP-binding protein MsbA [Gammaproteobacteria bacterium]NNF59773.1 lipid A export permease/ATP-binding protein MsbA [Gammaproteobacteria bacterium]NNM20967.1 lipid A export permease/ATP-binding protein MsbA [Gammaproteobacteria bacterium]